VRLLWLVGVTLLLAACAQPASAPTPVPVAPTIRQGVGGAITVEGHGSGKSDDVLPQFGPGGVPIGIDLLTISHNGNSTFVVNALQGGQFENVLQAIGAYKGQRPLVVTDSVAFDVTADGDWSITIGRLSTGGQPSFSGRGDAVSAYFTPPDPTVWNVSHDGRSTFRVYAHCAVRSILVEDVTGALQDAARIEFTRGPCFWEVRADGNWSLQPQL
jgi:hypothetical protein